MELESSAAEITSHTGCKQLEGFVRVVMDDSPDSVSTAQNNHNSAFADAVKRAKEVNVFSFTI